jgi:dipeptidyl aminopeptidase/acylaminoacyl peptidase
VKQLLFALCAFLCAALPVPSFSAAGTFDFGDLPKLVSVSGVQISPDGKRIAFIVSRADMKTNEYAHELDLVDVATGRIRTLTHTRPRVDDPRWSLDGSELAFTDEVDKKPQVFILPMDGGEAEQATHADEGVESYSWRPDAGAIAYIAPEKAVNEAEIKKHHDIFRVGDNDFLATKAPVNSRIWVQRVRDGSADGKPLQLTRGATSASGDLSWSADGTQIAFTRMPDGYRGHEAGVRAAVVDVATQRVTDLTTDAFSSDPAFAPHGSAIAYRIGKNGLWAFFSQAMLREGSQSRALAAQIDRDCSTLAWTESGALLMGTFEGPRIGLWRVSADGGATPLPLANVGAIDASSAKDGALAFDGSTGDDPSEVYYLAPNGREPRRLTDFNAFLASKTLGTTTELRWRNDGFDEDGIVTYPPGYDRTKTYPLALVIHGGPTGNGSTVDFDSLAQLIATRGFIVFQPNYRGSDNLGFAYAKATMGDLDKGAGTDVVAGIRALEAAASIDSKRIGVSGWSAGGLMTSWLIGNYNLWKAAVTGASVDDFVEQYDDEDIFDYLPALMGGATPWRGDGLTLYREHSPITYAKNVKAATLILSDTSDFRVPTVESYELYHALRESGATVEFDAIPAYGHFPMDPVQRFDVFKRWTDWLTAHV